VVLLVGNFVRKSDAYGSVGEELAERLEISGWQVCRTSYRQQKALKALEMLLTCWRERKRFEVAHVEIYSGRAFLWGEAVCRLLNWMGKPYVIGLHGGNLPNFLARRARRGRKLLESAFAVVSPSPYLKGAFARWRPDCELLPNGLDLSLYPGRVRRTPRPHLIWLRAFRRMYAPEVAVAAFAKVAQRFPEARLTMIGPDKHDGALDLAMNTARVMNVSERVTFVPGVPKTQVAGYLSQADIFLNTSTIDNTPVSVIEALACGLCVVSTNVGGLNHLLSDESDSLLVDPGDSGAMAGAVCRILAEDGLAGKLSENALRKAQSFDWRVVLPGWHRLLRAASRSASPRLESSPARKLTSPTT
jgi:glycosyltransferase involved in cell wall biosynthesis